MNLSSSTQGSFNTAPLLAWHYNNSSEKLDTATETNAAFGFGGTRLTLHLHHRAAGAFGRLDLGGLVKLSLNLRTGREHASR